MSSSMSGILLNLIVVSFVCSLIGSDAYLTEKPNFLQTCKRGTADFAECMTHAFQNIFTSWKNGVAGVQDPKPIDPLFISKFEVIEDSSSATPLAVNLRNITVTGLNKAIVNNVEMKSDSYNFKMTYWVPNTRMDGQYTAVGQALLFKIDSKGKMFMEIVNGTCTVLVKMELREQDKVKFFDVKSLKFTVHTIDKVRLHFSNLFKDDLLTENTNQVFNENWRLFFDVSKPKIEKEINKVLLVHFRSVFENVPANYFVTDAV